MPVIRRRSSKPYRWDVSSVGIEAVANQEKMVPREFITDDGFGITAACRRYLAPLIAGEAYPPYKDGIPSYATLRGARVKRRLGTVFSV
jgi:ATP-dependent phosphofructokinase / diphosphate-dependent phosphofructokinase